MDSVVTWQAIITVLGIIGAIITLYLRIYAVISAREKALAKDIQVVRNELQEYKTHIAETYITNDALSKSLARIEQSIERLTKRLDQVISQNKSSN